MQRLLVFIFILSAGSTASATTVCFSGSRYTINSIGSVNIDEFVDAYEDIAKKERRRFYNDTSQKGQESAAPLFYELQYPIGSESWKIRGKFSISYPENCYTGSGMSRSLQFELQMAKSRIDFMRLLGIHASYSQNKFLKPEALPYGTDYSVFVIPQPSFWFHFTGTKQELVDTVDYYLSSYRQAFERSIPKPARFAPLESNTNTFSDQRIFKWRINFAWNGNAVYYGSPLTQTIAFESDLQRYRREILKSVGIETELKQSDIIRTLDTKMADTYAAESEKYRNLRSVKTAIALRNGASKPVGNTKNTVLSRAAECERDNHIAASDTSQDALEKTSQFMNCIISDDVMAKADRIGVELESAKASYTCLQDAATVAEKAVCLKSRLNEGDEKTLAIASCIDKKDAAGCFGESLLTDGQKKLASDLNCFAKAWTNKGRAKCVADSVGGDTVELATCLSDSKSDEDKFMCAVDGRLGKNEAAALEVARCLSKADDNVARLNCAAKGNMGENEREALRLATCAASSSSYVGAAACAAGEKLTYEQQTFIECAGAASTGPQSYAACVGGRLAAKEVTKCLESGFGTDDGCFGKNNFFRVQIENIRRDACNAVGNNAEACGALTYIVDNAIMPGKNHELDKYFNHGLSDIRNGPGKNNEFVKAVKHADKIIQDVGGNTEKALQDIDREVSMAHQDLNIAIAKAEADFSRETENAIRDANRVIDDAYQAANNVSEEVAKGAQVVLDTIKNAGQHYEREARKETQKGLDKINRAIGVGSGGIKL